MKHTRKMLIAHLGHRGVRARRGDHRDAPALAHPRRPPGRASSPPRRGPRTAPSRSMSRVTALAASLESPRVSSAASPHLLRRARPPPALTCCDGDARPRRRVAIAEVGLVEPVSEQVQPDGEPAARRPLQPSDPATAAAALAVRPVSSARRVERWGEVGIVSLGRAPYKRCGLGGKALLRRGDAVSWRCRSARRGRWSRCWPRRCRPRNSGSG
jgi:hypothetical protein